MSLIKLLEQTPLWLRVAVLVAAWGVAGQAEAATVGAHIGSWHSEPGFNNVNPGLYAQADNGGTAGIYRNSVRKVSTYAGWTFEKQLGESVTVSATVGAITGYPAAKLLPMVIPSIKVKLFDEVSARVIIIPMVNPKQCAHVVSFAIETKF